MEPLELDYLEPVSEDDYRFLDDFLHLDTVSGDAMPLDMVEGFFTGIICGPGMTLPSDWLPVIWGKNEPEFDSEEEAGRVMGILFRMYNEINSILRSGGTFEPMLPVGNVDDAEYRICDDWCSGFLEGMEFWDSCWQDYLDDELTIFLGVILLVGVQEFDEAVTKNGGEMAPTLEEIPDMLPGMIKEIYDHLAPCRKKMVPGHVPSVRKKKKTGRNDLCPCGSGKKFKKCCAGLTIH